MDYYAEKAITNIYHGYTVSETEYYSLMKCAKFGGADGQRACDALARAERYNGYNQPFRYIRYRDKFRFISMQNCT